MIHRPYLRDFHVLLAIICYLACFFFPAIYVGDSFEPQSPLGLLLMGWAAALELNFGWFANPALAAAVCLARSRPRMSATLASVALVLALSFPFYGYVRVHEISSRSPVAAYGWGYALWVTSMALFAAGQLARVRGARDGFAALTALLAGGLVLVAHGIYLASGAGGLHAYTNERERMFEASCATAGMRVLRRVEGVRSVFLDPDWSWTIGQRSLRTTELRYRTDGKIMRNDFLRSGKLEYVESAVTEGQQDILRFGRGDLAGSPVQQLQSVYAVLTQPHDLPFHLGLWGETVMVKDRRDDSLLASASYVLDSQTGRYCGPPGFSAQAFAADVLGLKPRLK
ncbi:hypothetical protein [Pseudoxanthomonas sp. UTMC 1351]|uniref:hypothetical protein n=1 Tax=Pseudoxanthomonas sp. UTMC 1351 TaxID=2695853 RepID=UPI0034CDE972